jgi:hypothetical protein
MKGLLVVAYREIQERRFIFVAAVVASVLPFLAPLVPAIGRFPHDDARDLTAFFFSLTFLIVVSLGLGGGVIGRDLVERRLGFYFSKPIGGIAIAMGKILGSFLLALGAGTIILLPATLFGGGFRRLATTEVTLAEREHWSLLEVSVGPALSIAFFCLLALALVEFAHALGIAIRSRSVWLLVDMACLILCLGIVYAASRQLIWISPVSFRRTWTLFGIALVVLATPGLLIATAAQGTIGRTDLLRGHRALSIVFWGWSLLIGTVLLIGSWWYVNPTPRDLAALGRVVPASAGDWIDVWGIARHRRQYGARFLYNVKTRQFRLVHDPWSGVPLVFSNDGRAVAWLDGDPDKVGFYEVVTASLTDKVTDERRMRFDDSVLLPLFFLSQDGSRVALVRGSLLSVVDRLSMRSVLSIRLPPLEGYTEVAHAFLTNNEIRMVRCCRSDASMVIYMVDIASRRLVETGQIKWTYSVLLSGSNGDLLIRDKETGRVTLRDGRTGNLLAQLSTDAPHVNDDNGTPGASKRPTVHPVFLSDGRILVCEVRDGAGRLSVFSSSGSLERVSEIGNVEGLYPAGQPSEEEILIAIKKPGTCSLLRFDFTSGNTHELEGSSLFPLLFPLLQIDQQNEWRPGSTATKLFFGPEYESLVYFDYQTGERRVILPSRGH